MKQFSKVMFSTALVLASTLAHSATLPNGINGLKVGMARSDVVKPLNKIYGRDVSNLLECRSADNIDAGSSECIIKAPGFNYAGVAGQAISMTFFGPRLVFVQVVFVPPKSDKEREAQLKKATATLASTLSAAPTLMPGGSVFVLADGSGFSVGPRDSNIAVSLVSTEYMEAQDRKAQQH